MPRPLAACLIALAGCGEHGHGTTVDAQGGDADGGGTAPTLVAMPTSLDFGTAPLDSTTPPLTVTLLYTGVPGPGAQTIVGGDASNFAVESSTLSISDTTTIRVRFTPQKVGPVAADLVVSTTDAKAVIGLRGLVISAAGLLIAPSVHDFGAVGVGTTTAQTFTLTNATGVRTGALAVSVTGADAAQFTKSADTCNGAMIAENASCTMTVAFTPASPGPKAATLQIAGTPGGTATASLAGSGSAGAGIVITPSTFDFGTVSQGNSSLGKMFTITNNATTSTGLLATTMAGNHPGDFIKQLDQCNNHALGPGNQCTLFITFEPGPTGTRNARLQVAASPGGFAAADVSGTCVP